MVRHAGVTLALYQVARATGDDRYQDAADRGLAWMLDRLHAEADWTALMEGSSAPLGGSALMLAALAERRLLTGDETYDDEMRGLGNFLAAMQRDNGDFFVAYDPATHEPDRVTISQYYAGESLWALARLENALPDARYRDAALRAAHFIANDRNDRDFVPVGPLNDHWASYGFAEMADWPITDSEADYARALSGRFQLLTRWEAQKDGGAPYSWTHGPERTRRRARNVGRGSGRARPARARRRSPRRPSGRHAGEHRVRRRRARAAPDTTRTTLASRARGSPTTRPGWTTSNTRSPGCSDWPTCSIRGPPRLASRNERPRRRPPPRDLDPRGDRSDLGGHRCARSRGRTARRAIGRSSSSCGCAIAFVVLAGAALLADPLLDALHISAPAAELAAGLVVLVPALDLLWQGPAERLRPAARARAVRLALFPFGIPLVAGPAASPATIAWAATEGAGVTVGGAAIGHGGRRGRGHGLAIATAVVARRASWARSPPSRWRSSRSTSSGTASSAS